MIKDIEDLQAWQEARILRKFVYQITKDFPSEEKFITVKHMRSCARNIPGNIAEAFGRFHYQESMQFYRIARGSLEELRSDTICSRDSEFINAENFKILIDQMNKVGKLLNGLLKSTIKIKNYPIN